MKKMLLALAAVLLLLCAAGCGAGDKAVSSEISEPEVLDLSEMSGTVVYAEVYNMMSSPDDYTGKTIKVSGQCASTFYEPTQEYYHFVVIADATACCQQGIEFALEDGNSDYPTDGENIVVTGVYECYEELGETYYHLAGCELS